MFILTKIQDLVQIHPKALHEQGSVQCLEDEINKKYSNKVIQKIGLCICLYDLLAASDGQIGNGSALISVNVEFRLIVFRPFKNEVMTGRISSSNPDGVHLKTQFFTEIFVPSHYLPDNSTYSREYDTWIWSYEDNDLYFDKGECVRFRVEDENWQDQAPTKPEMDRDERDGAEEKKKTSPFQIVGAMDEMGLGPCLWWDSEEGDGVSEGGE